MMFTRTLSFVVLMLLVLAASVQAQVSITYSSAGDAYFTMDIPDEWQVNVGSEKDISQNEEAELQPVRLISAMPNSGEPLWFGMWVPPDLGEIEDAKEYVASLGIDLLSDVVITEVREDILNSMEVKYVSGTGNKDDELMDFRAGLFQLSPDQVAIAIYIGPADSTSRHGEELKEMIQSLQSLIQ